MANETIQLLNKTAQGGTHQVLDVPDVPKVIELIGEQNQLVIDARDIVEFTFEHSNRDIDTYHLKVVIRGNASQFAVWFNTTPPGTWNKIQGAYDGTSTTFLLSYITAMGTLYRAVVAHNLGTEPDMTTSIADRIVNSNRMMGDPVYIYNSPLNLDSHPGAALDVQKAALTQVTTDEPVAFAQGQLIADSVGTVAIISAVNATTVTTVTIARSFSLPDAGLSQQILAKNSNTTDDVYWKTIKELPPTNMGEGGEFLVKLNNSINSPLAWNTAGQFVPNPNNTGVLAYDVLTAKLTPGNPTLRYVGWEHIWTNIYLGLVVLRVNTGRITINPTYLGTTVVSSIGPGNDADAIFITPRSPGDRVGGMILVDGSRIAICTDFVSTNTPATFITIHT